MNRPIPDSALFPPEYIWREVECPTCRGAGVVPCPWCHGEGTYLNTDEQAIESCSDCNGPGTLLCDACRGDGVIDVEVER